MLTIGTLLSNISKGQSGVPTKMIFQQLNMVYDKLKPNIRILKAEMVNNGTQIYLYVPSENNERLYYDVDIWFNSKTTIATTTPFKIYSNSPAFGYSYVYIFNQMGALLFPEKYPRIMLTNPPKVRNPFGAISFDKHVYAGLAHLFKQNLAALVQMSDDSRPVHVDSFDDKMTESKRKHVAGDKSPQTSPFKGKK